MSSTPITLYPMESRESVWHDFLNHEIAPFWQTHRQAFTYRTPDNVTLHYALFEQTTTLNKKQEDADLSQDTQQQNKLIILLPGRVETYLKYQEVIYDLFQAGFSILTVDHRGQGMSSRLLSDHEKGYVASFVDYADDLQAIIKHAQVENNYQDIHCLAHSMGGTIALAWLEKYQISLSSLILTAPMLGVNAGPLNQKMALWVAYLIDQASKVFCAEPPYFIGQHGYFRQTFLSNVLCSSQVRFEFAHSLQAQYKLGGVTSTWLYQALKIINRANRISENIRCRTLLLQAEKEVVVSVQAQDDWCNAGKLKGMDVEKYIVNNAKHEILMETDEIRAPVMKTIIEFLRR